MTQDGICYFQTLPIDLKFLFSYLAFRDITSSTKNSSDLFLYDSFILFLCQIYYISCFVGF